MSTLKQKLPRIPSPIREMIKDNIKDAYKDGHKPSSFSSAFLWSDAKHIPDHDFWCGIYEEVKLMI